MRKWTSDNPRYLFYTLLVIAAVATLSYAIYAFIGMFVFGLFIYYVTRPVHRTLNKTIGHPNISATIAITAFVLPFIVIMSYTGLVALQELRILISTEYINEIKQFIDVDLSTTDTLRDDIETIMTEPGTIEALISTISGYATIFATVLINTFLIVLVTFYALKDGGMARQEFEQVFGEDTTFVEFLESIDRDFEILFFGNILYAIFTAVIASITYLVMSIFSPIGVDLPYPFLLGVLTGITSLIPIIGVKLVYIPLFGVLAVESYLAGPETYWFPILFAILALIIIDTIPDFIVRPYVSGDRLHMGSLIFAYVFGPVVFGWYGLFLGPILLIFVTNIYRIILPEYIASLRLKKVNSGDDINVELDGETVPATVVEVEADRVKVSIRMENNDYSSIKKVEPSQIELT